MNHLYRYFVDYKENRRMESKKNPRKPRLERRNAVKNFDYDASFSSSSNSSFDVSGSSSLITRSLYLPDKTSFRVEGFDGEFDKICRSLGLSVDDFLIPTLAWEGRKIRSSSDLLPRSTLNELRSPKTEEVEGKGSEVADRVSDSSLVESNEAGDVVAELGNTFGSTVGAMGVMEFIRNEPSWSNASGNGGGIKGVRPPVLKPPPSMALPVIDNSCSTWDILRDFAPVGDRGYSSRYHEEVSSSDNEEDTEGVEEVQREEETEVRPGETNMLSTSCSFTTSNDDDSSSTTTEPTSNMSPNGRFKLTITYWERGELLGRGSFGSVYEGISDDGFFFAVKEVSLLDQGSQGKQSVFQLEQEIALLSQFQHENIVQYYGTDKDESKLYIFLELVTKGSLQSLYSKYHLRDSQVSAYTRQILHGLKYLHDRNVIHRDIKCANILVDASGSVKLADFGLAKATRLNDVKSCKGTAFWMAPEVVKNHKNHGYGLPADIWSLGCTVLEMLTRQIPYSYLECQMQALYKIGKGVPPEIPETLSKDAQAFIMQCLKVDPNDRPTAAQLLDHPFVKRPLTSSGGSASPFLGRRF